MRVGSVRENLGRQWFCQSWSLQVNDAPARDWMDTLTKPWFRPQVLSRPDTQWTFGDPLLNWNYICLKGKTDNCNFPPSPSQTHKLTEIESTMLGQVFNGWKCIHGHIYQNCRSWDCFRCMLLPHRSLSSFPSMPVNRCSSSESEGRAGAYRYRKQSNYDCEWTIYVWVVYSTELKTSIIKL